MTNQIFRVEARRETEDEELRAHPEAIEDTYLPLIDKRKELRATPQ